MAKKKPLTFEQFADFFDRLTLDPDAPQRVSERSWYVDVETIRKKQYDLKAINPNAPDNSDKRTPDELIAVIGQAQKEIDDALQALMQSLD